MQIFASVPHRVRSSTWTSASSTVCLRGPAHLHTSTVFGYAVVLAHLGYRRRRPWDFLKYILKNPMNYASAPGLPGEAEERWPRRASRRAFAAALAARCAAPTIHRMMSLVDKKTLHCVQGVFLMAPGRCKAKENWAQDEAQNGR